MSRTQENIDEGYMKRCLQLAALGLGGVSTNPLVGCVIVYNDRVIGEGYHKQYGEAHAEVNAINSVEDKSLLKESTLYVNLEPCAHYGKTPPCSDLIVKYDVKRVVVGTIDTFSQVAGKGIEKLKNACIELKVDVLSDECRQINKRFFTYNEKERPYIILKWAQTADGFIGRDNSDAEFSKRISNEYTDVAVHKWRANEDAILVGTNTAIIDNPSLTTRLWKGKNPVRVLVDYDLKVPITHRLYDNEVKTIIINSRKEESNGNTFFAKVEDKSLNSVLEVLYQHKIQSLIVEGGAKLLQSFIDSKLWDEARVISSKDSWVSGIKAPAIYGEIISKKEVENDVITTFLK